jgi:hypothetical protein
MIGPATSFTMGVDNNMMITALWGVFIWKEIVR